MNHYLTREVKDQLYALEKEHRKIVQRLQGEKDVAEMKAYTLSIVLGCIVFFGAIFALYPA